MAFAFSRACVDFTRSSGFHPQFKNTDPFLIPTWSSSGSQNWLSTACKSPQPWTSWPSVLDVLAVSFLHTSDFNVTYSEWHQVQQKPVKDSFQSGVLKEGNIWNMQRIRVGNLWGQNGDQSSVYPVICLLDAGEGHLLPVTLIRSEAVYKQQHFSKEDLPEVDYPKFFLRPFLPSHPSFTCLTLKPNRLLLFLCWMLMLTGMTHRLSWDVCVPLNCKEVVVFQVLIGCKL